MPSRTVTFARRLRREMSPPEMLLWGALRRRGNGWRFRRQHPLGLFVLDSYCAEARLAVGVDGTDHGLSDRLRRDAERDEWLLSQGVATLRVQAIEVRDNLEGVWDGIATRVAERVVEVAESRLQRQAGKAPPTAR